MSRCFVIQPFDKGKYDQRYYDHLKPAIEKAGLEAYRVDEDHSVTVPIEAIEKEISRSTICLADITEDNPNVWYELGYAFASDCPVVMICHAQRRSQFPFDIRHRKVIRYSTESKKDFETLEQEIYHTIIATSKNDTPRQVKTIKNSSNETSIERESFFLSVLANEINFPRDTVSVYRLKSEARQLGLYGIGFNMAFASLLEKEYVEVTEELDYNDTYQAAKITEFGWKWITDNPELFESQERHVQSKSVPPPIMVEDLDDDIPF